MLINTEITLAFKRFYGDYSIKKTSIFDIGKIGNQFPGLEAKFNEKREVTLSMKCPLCGNYHQYSYGLYDLINKEIIIGGCYDLGIPIFYIGKHNRIEQKIIKFKQTNKEMYAMI